MFGNEETHGDGNDDDDEEETNDEIGLMIYK